MLECRRSWRRTRVGEVVELEPFAIRCSGCMRYMIVKPYCGLRNCDRCAAKNARKLERRYLPAIIEAKNKKSSMWTFLTLEGVLIDAEWDLRKTLKRFNDVATEFSKSLYPEGGIGVVEHTGRVVVKCVGHAESAGEFLGINIGGPCSLIEYFRSLYVHYHAMVKGGFHAFENVARAWRQALLDAGFLSKDHDPLGGKHGVYLSLARNVKSAAQYIMKYIAKGVELDDLQAELLARLKYVRSWGILYNPISPTFDMICMDCEARCYIDWEVPYREPVESEKLHIKMVERPP